MPSVDDILGPAPQQQSTYARNSAWAKPGGYTTPLSAQDETAFQGWVKKNNVPWKDEPTADYDMRGFWKAQQSGDPSARTAMNANDGKMHFTDKFKTPYHKSFSAESMYADPKKAPRWNDKDQLVTPDGKVVFDERAGGKPSVADILGPEPPPQDPNAHRGWGRFAMTAATEFASGLLDQGLNTGAGSPTMAYYRTQQLAKGKMTPEEYAQGPKQNPATEAADAALDKRGALWRPQGAGERAAYGAFQGALGAATGGGGGLVRRGLQGLAGAVQGGAVSTAMEAVPDEYKQAASSALNAILPMLGVRGRPPDAEARAREIMTKAGVPEEHQGALIAAAKRQGAEDYTKSGQAIQKDLGGAQEKAAADAVKNHEAAVQEAETRHGDAVAQGDKIARTGLDAVAKAAASARAKAPGKFPDFVAKLFTSTREALSTQAKKVYREALGPAADAPVDERNIADLKGAAKLFSDNMPKDLADALTPGLIKRIRDLGDARTPQDAAGEEGTPPEPVTLAELHYLRSALRDLAWTPSVKGDFGKRGFSQMAEAVDKAINSLSNSPDVRAAARRLKRADAWYEKQIRPYNSKVIQTLVDNMRPGFAENEYVGRTLMKDGFLGGLQKMLRMGGTDFRNQMKSFSLNDAMDGARITDASGGKGYIDPAKMLHTIHDNRAAWDMVHGKATVDRYVRGLANAAQRDGRLPDNHRGSGDLDAVLAEEKTQADKLAALRKVDPVKLMQQAAEGALPKELQGLDGLPHAAAQRILRDPTVAARALKVMGPKATRMLKSEALSSLLAPLLRGNERGTASRVNKANTSVLDQMFPPEAVRSLTEIRDRFYADRTRDHLVTDALWSIGATLHRMMLWTHGPQVVSALAHRLRVAKPEDVAQIRYDLVRAGLQASAATSGENPDEDDQ